MRLATHHHGALRIPRGHSNDSAEHSSAAVPCILRIFSCMPPPPHSRSTAHPLFVSFSWALGTSVGPIKRSATSAARPELIENQFVQSFRAASNRGKSAFCSPQLGPISRMTETKIGADHRSKTCRHCFISRSVAQCIPRSLRSCPRPALYLVCRCPVQSQLETVVTRARTFMNAART